MCSRTTRHHATTRRSLLGFVAAGPPIALPTGNPDEARALLPAGNARLPAGRPSAPHRDIERLEEIAPRQAPFVTRIAVPLIEDGKLEVGGGVYDLESGRVTPVAAA